MADLTRKEALQLTVRIRDAADTVYLLLLEAQDRGAAKALGYRSFEDYCASEFDLGRGNAYRLINQGTVIRELTEAAGAAVAVSARTATALKPQIKELVSEVREVTAGLAPKKRAKAAQALVDERARDTRNLSRARDTSPPPDEKPPPVTPPPPVAAPAPPGPSRRLQSVYESFVPFFATDAREVAAMSSYEEWKARLRMARKWVDQYELGVKGVAPTGRAATPPPRAQAARTAVAGTSRGQGGSGPVGGREVTTMFKQPKK